MTRAGPSALVGVLAFVSLSACGSVEQPGRGSAPTSSVPSSASAPRPPRPAATTPTAAATQAGPQFPAPQPTDVRIVPPGSTVGKQFRVRVKGTVSEGIEAGCRVLRSKGVVYELIWRDGTLVNGQQVEVEGTLQPGLATTCQQGTPLLVERILNQ